MRRFVVIGNNATASPDFSVEDIPGTSGRLDVLLRCIRAALLVSHGLRRDALVYLVLLGGPRAPRVVRVDGATAQYLRPDERSLATLVRKVLASTGGPACFVAVRPGIALAEGGVEVVLQDIGVAKPYVLDEGGTDLRDAAVDWRDAVFFVGDHRGLDLATRAAIAAPDALPLRVGPISVHADDAITLVSNELDRREACDRGARDL